MDKGNIVRTPLSAERNHCGASVRVYLLVALLINIVTAIPYVVAYVTCPSDMVPSGFTYNVVDQNAYFAWMLQGYQGRFFLVNRFTSENVPNRLFISFFWFLGVIMRISGLSAIIIYQVARIGGIFAFCLVAWRFCEKFTTTRVQLVLAFLLICTSAGLGGILYGVLGRAQGAIDLWETDAIPFQCMYLYPLHSWALVFKILAMWGVHSYEKEDNVWTRRAVFSGVLFLLATFHPYDVVSVVGAAGLYILLLWVRGHRVTLRFLWSVIWPFLPAVGVLCYLYLGFLSDPHWRVIISQSVVETPPVKYLLFGMGIPLFLCAVYLGVMIPYNWRVLSNTDLFLLAWLASGSVLLYFPVQFQAKFMLGLSVPICILAARGICEIVVPFLRRIGILAGARFVVPDNILWPGLLLVFTFSSNAYWLIRDTKNAIIATPPFVLPKAEVAAMDWLAGHSGGNEPVVLCAPIIGNALPARASVRSFVGHWGFTVNYLSKKQTVRQFFHPGFNDNFRIEIARKNGVKYIYWGRFEREWSGLAFTLGPPFQKVYDREGVRIYMLPSEPRDE